NVGAPDAFLEIVEDDDRRTAAETTKRALVELGPDAGARAEGEEADVLAAEAEREDEEPGAAVLVRLGIAHHGPLPVVDLPFLARGGVNRGVRFGGRGAPELADEAHDARVAGRKAVAVDEILPDRHRVPALDERRRDQFA